MKFTVYILILILLALGCAGRANKVKTKGEMLEATSQKEVFTPAYPELIEMYNKGRFDEFYSALDSVKIMGASGNIECSEYANEYIDQPISNYLRKFKLDVNEDSATASILILDYSKYLKRIEFNQLLPKGTYIYTCNRNELFYGLDSGLYYYLIKIGSDRTVLKDTVLK
jgi:hypothetical protein